MFTPKPFASQWHRFVFDIVFSSEEFTLIKRGHEPDDYDEKWVIRFEHDEWLRCYRATTGECIFMVQFEKEKEEIRIKEARVVADPSVYNESNLRLSAETLRSLLYGILLRKDSVNSELPDVQDLGLVSESLEGQSSVVDSPILGIDAKVRDKTTRQSESSTRSILLLLYLLLYVVQPALLYAGLIAGFQEAGAVGVSESFLIFLMIVTGFLWPFVFFTGYLGTVAAFPHDRKGALFVFLPLLIAVGNQLFFRDAVFSSGAFLDAAPILFADVLCFLLGIKTVFQTAQQKPAARMVAGCSSLLYRVLGWGLLGVGVITVLSFIQDLPSDTAATSLILFVVTFIIHTRARKPMYVAAAKLRKY